MANISDAVWSIMPQTWTSNTYSNVSSSTISYPAQTSGYVQVQAPVEAAPKKPLTPVDWLRERIDETCRVGRLRLETPW